MLFISLSGQSGSSLYFSLNEYYTQLCSFVFCTQLRFYFQNFILLWTAFVWSFFQIPPFEVWTLGFRLCIVRKRLRSQFAASNILTSNIEKICKFFTMNKPISLFFFASWLVMRLIDDHSRQENSVSKLIWFFFPIVFSIGTMLFFDVCFNDLTNVLLI